MTTLDSKNDPFAAAFGQTKSEPFVAFGSSKSVSFYQVIVETFIHNRFSVLSAKCGRRSIRK